MKTFLEYLKFYIVTEDDSALKLLNTLFVFY